MKKCPKCSGSNWDTAVCCAACGTYLAASAEAEQAEFRWVGEPDIPIPPARTVPPRIAPLITCPHCFAGNERTAETCRRCDRELPLPLTPPSQAVGRPPGTTSRPYGQQAEPASLFSQVLGWLFLGGLAIGGIWLLSHLGGSGSGQCVEWDFDGRSSYCVEWIDVESDYDYDEPYYPDYEPPSERLSNHAVGDVDCADFSWHYQAQAFFESEGDPNRDPHLLDSDFEGIACELLP